MFILFSYFHAAVVMILILTEMRVWQLVTRVMDLPGISSYILQRLFMLSTRLEIYQFCFVIHNFLKGLKRKSVVPCHPAILVTHFSFLLRLYLIASPHSGETIVSSHLDKLNYLAHYLLLTLPLIIQTLLIKLFLI